MKDYCMKDKIEIVNDTEMIIHCDLEEGHKSPHRATITDYITWRNVV